MSFKVAVGIASFNRPDFLVEALNTITSQSLAPHEIRILDNQSTKPVREAVTPFLEKGAIWSVSQQPGLNAMQNFQRALGELDGDYVCVLHDDDRLKPEFLKTLIDFLEKNPRIGAVGCRTELINEAGESVGDSPHPPDSSFNGAREIVFKNSSAAAAFYSHSYVPFPTWIYRGKYRSLISQLYAPHKVGDVFTLVQLADAVPIAVLKDRLLEYRIHGGQESAIYTSEQANQLEWFLFHHCRKEFRYWISAIPSLLTKLMKRKIKRLFRR